MKHNNYVDVNMTDIENDIKIWIKNSLMCSSDIVVLFGRCAPLVYPYIDEIQEITNFKGDVVTENALLVLSESIASEYIKTNKFPSILIMLDVLVHGRILNLVMNKFKNSIIKYIEKGMSNFNRDKILDDFIRSIYISVYAGTFKLLLDPEYVMRCSYHKKIDSRDLKTSNEIVSLIKQNSGLIQPNIISIRTDLSKPFFILENNDWKKIRSSSNLDMVEFWYMKGFEKNNIIFLVKKSICDSSVQYTPYCFIPKISPEQLTSILRKILNKIKFYGYEDLYNGLILYFNKISENISIISAYYQLFKLILSQIVLKIFLECYEIQDYVHDSNRVSCNFDKNYNSSNFRNLLEILILVKWSKEDLYSIFSDITFTEYNSSKNQPIEFSIYQLALDHEICAEKLLGCNLEEKYYAIYENNRTGETDIYELIYDNIYERFLKNSVDVIELMDDGIVSMQTRVHTHRLSILYFYEAASTTDMTLILIKRLLGNYYLSFKRFCGFYWWGSDIVERILRYFKDDLHVDANVLIYVEFFSRMINRYPSIVNLILDRENFDR